MIAFKIIYLPICFMLFINGEFSNAAKIKVEDPNTDFDYIAFLKALYVKRPNEDDFVLYESSQELCLCVNREMSSSMSIYEWNADSTFVTFYQRLVTFEVFAPRTTSFTVEIDEEIWRFRCAFEPGQSTMYTIYFFLSLNSGEGGWKFKMDINKVESYTKTDSALEPIIYNVEDLQPAQLYESKIKINDDTKKRFDIVTTRVVAERTRLAFCTGYFKIKKSNEKVILAFDDFPGTFYIFHFSNPEQAELFEKFILISDDYVTDDVILHVPLDLLLYADP